MAKTIVRPGRRVGAHGVPERPGGRRRPCRSVGSSRMIRSGSGTSARANFSRCCSPPEHACTRRAASAVRRGALDDLVDPVAAAVERGDRLRRSRATVKSGSRPPVCITADTRPARDRPAGVRAVRPRRCPRRAWSGRAACRPWWSCRRRWGRGTRRSRRAAMVRSTSSTATTVRAVGGPEGLAEAGGPDRGWGGVLMAPACRRTPLRARAGVSRPGRDTCHRRRCRSVADRRHAG